MGAAAGGVTLDLYYDNPVAGPNSGNVTSDNPNYCRNLRTSAPAPTTPINTPCGERRRCRRHLATSTAMRVRRGPVRGPDPAFHIERDLGPA